MRFVHLAASIAVLSGTLALAVPASAQDSANLGTCATMQDQVKAALSSNSQSPNYENAVKEQRYGLEFCSEGFYRNGAAHYSQALRLLGAQQN
ncbi:MAG: hypothetical protein ABSD74_07055 [Rhizomicrobium sp.]|jgi:hypothetical protein